MGRSNTVPAAAHSPKTWRHLLQPTSLRRRVTSILSLADSPFRSRFLFNSPAAMNAMKKDADMNPATIYSVETNSNPSNEDNSGWMQETMDAVFAVDTSPQLSPLPVIAEETSTDQLPTPPLDSPRTLHSISTACSDLDDDKLHRAVNESLRDVATVYFQQQRQQQQQQQDSATPPPPRSSSSNQNKSPEKLRSLKGEHALREMVETEKRYVDALHLLFHGYLEPIDELAWIPADDKCVLVRNARELLDFQREFLEVLENATGTPTANSEEVDCGTFEQLAYCFMQPANKFNIYSEYLIFHDEALRVLDTYRKKPEWETFERACYDRILEGGDGVRLELKDLMIMPVQRICRYPLLLKEILRYTLPHSPAYPELCRAHKMMRTTIERINTTKQAIERSLRTRRFCERLVCDWRLSKEFVRGLGDLVIAGPLHFVNLCGVNGKQKDLEEVEVKYYGCFVFTTYVIIVRARSTEYEPVHWFPLRMFTLQDLEEGEGVLGEAWRLTYKHRQFEFGAACPQEKRLWIQVLSRTIAEGSVLPLKPSVSGTEKGAGSLSLTGILMPIEDSTWARRRQVRSMTASKSAEGETPPPGHHSRRETNVSRSISDPHRQQMRPLSYMPTISNHGNDTVYPATPLPSPANSLRINTAAANVYKSHSSPSSPKSPVRLRSASGVGWSVRSAVDEKFNDVSTLDCLSARTRSLVMRKKEGRKSILEWEEA
ncbi:uncharacterized protein VTP21DRAFT_4816 [Calcarisporiella thermophila]|uniref:uncharacterized protein n=1 Tax=Calcarisporiella thermophila TaxID=911321 RepID=UPI00374469C4